MAPAFACDHCFIQIETINILRTGMTSLDVGCWGSGLRICTQYLLEFELCRSMLLDLHDYTRRGGVAFTSTTCQEHEVCAVASDSD